MRTRRQHPNHRTVNQAHLELTLLDVISAEAGALKLAAAANDRDDMAYTLANLHALVEQAQHQLLDDQTIDETAPGTWRTNGAYTLPKHTRSTEEAGR